MKEKIDIEENEILTFPCVPARDLVVFPNMIVHFDIGRASSIKAMKKALSGDGYVFIAAQVEYECEIPQLEDMYEIGTICRVKQVVKSSGGVYRCLVEGIRKARLLSLSLVDRYFSAEVKRLPNYSSEVIEEVELEALFREAKGVFYEYAGIIPRMPNELYNQIIGAQDARSIYEAIVFNIPLPFDDKQKLLEIDTLGERLALLISTLSREIEVISLEEDIHSKVQNAIDQNQREYYIRQQIKVLQDELSNPFMEDNDASEVERYYEKLSRLNLPDEVYEKFSEEIRNLSRSNGAPQETAVIRTYLDICLSLPWNKVSKDRTDITRAQRILDKDHYGMKRVKERILETFAVRSLSPDVKGQILCLVGPPGVGKTSVGKSIARALNRKYVRVSLGGVRDESDIRGHRKTYIGAMPGRIINAMKLAGTKNPVMLLDEIDKMSNDFRGDPSSAMLEVLDSEQNSAFRDHYIEVPFDLSQVLFITTANTLDTIQPPLLDRMEVIELSSYTREEKFNIAKKHLIPKQLKKNGMKASQMRIANDAIYVLIDYYTREAGVRKLERAIGSLCRKAAKEIVEEGKAKVTFNADNLENYLGHKKYLSDICSKENQVGVVNGLAWTSVGGVIMPLEVLVLDGKGKTQLTGSLGDVMKESAKIAVSLARSMAERYNIPADFYENKDLHIHAPEGAVPKDGPSAGVTMTTALISALSGIPVRSDVAMTGEITLHGRVLPIGGLREKTMAAYKAGIKTVIVPKDNMGDLDEIDDTVKLGLEFVFADNISDVLEAALCDTPIAKPIEKLPYNIVDEPVRRRKKAVTKV